MRSKQVFTPVAASPSDSTPAESVTQTFQSESPRKSGILNRRPGVLSRTSVTRSLSKQTQRTIRATSINLQTDGSSTSSFRQQDVPIQDIDNSTTIIEQLPQLSANNEDNQVEGASPTTTMVIPVVVIDSEEQPFEETEKTVVVHVSRMEPCDSETDGRTFFDELPVLQENTSTTGMATSDSEATVTAEAGGDEQEITSPPMKEVYLSVKKAPKVSAEDSDVASGMTSSSLGPLKWYEDDQLTEHLQCLLCDQSMQPSQLMQHVTDLHGRRLPEVGRAAFLKYIRMKKIPVAITSGRVRSSGRDGVGVCPNCKRNFTKRLDLLSHMHEEHGLGFVLFDYEFESISQFEKWLEYITVEFMTGYSKYRTNVNAVGIKSQMYLCRLESKPVCKATTYKTDRRARNRTKTTYCTAHLQVRFLEGGRLHVKGSPTHINHPVDLFNAYRSLDDVPFDALPGYVSVNSKTSGGMYARTVEFCQKVLRRTQSLSDILNASPAPSDFNAIHHLHSKLQALNELLATYKFRTITIHEETPSETLILR